MRLSATLYTQEEVHTIMETLFTSPDIPKAIDKTVPLHMLDLGRHVTLVETMPKFDQWGLVPEGHVGPREDPESAAQGAPAEGDEETTVTPVESDAGATGASGGSASPAESSSTSESAAPEVEAHEASSGSSGQFVVAPSQRAEGQEESDDDGASSGHCEPRSKAVHDRAAGSPAGISLKRKAEAAIEGSGAGAAPPRPWRSSNTVWVDSRAKTSG